MKHYAIFMIMAVLAVGCVSGTPPASVLVPYINIDSPSNGQNILGNSIEVVLSTNIHLVLPGGEPKDSTGHFHVYLDGENEKRGVQTSFMFENIQPGVHTIRAELHRNDHSPYEDVVKTVTVNVGGSPATIATKQFDMTAKQFAFEPSTIEVNQGDVVVLKIKSVDVEHGIAIPDFGVSQKLEPGKEAVVQFTADKKGTYTFFCNVLCGSGHADMTGTLVVK